MNSNEESRENFDFPFSPEDFTNPFQNLVLDLSNQLQSLDTWLKCRQLNVNPSDLDDLSKVEVRLSAMEACVSKMDNLTSNEEKALKFMERMLKQCELQNERLCEIEKNLPKHLPYVPIKNNTPKNQENIHPNIMAGMSTTTTATATMTTMTNAMASAPSSVPSSSRGREENLYEKKANNGNRRSSSRPGKRDKSGAHATTSLAVSQLQPVSMEEMSTIPKYMRGRLTQERINDCIAKINLEIIKKYQILHGNSDKMSSHEMELYA
ncbi:hypothetical protein RFI_28302, partial [Reticulomyxa filosa]